MVVETSISNQNREVKVDERHTIEFDTHTGESLGVECTQEKINSILEKLTCLFLENCDPPQISQMDLCERLVFAVILYKKNKRDMNIAISQDEFSKLFFEITSRKSTKRPEEKLKFIFKRSLKHLLKCFSQSHFKTTKFSSGKCLLKKFYMHYYTRIANKLNLSLEEFFPPNRSRSVQATSSKTLNLQYLTKLAQNPEILTSMVKYINELFVKDYLIEMQNGLRGLIIKITKMINEYYLRSETVIKRSQANLFQPNEINSLANLVPKNFDGNQVEKELHTANRQKGFDKAVKLFWEMKDTILKQKMKIPWTMSEVKSGMMFVQKKLLRIQKKI